MIWVPVGLGIFILLSYLAYKLLKFMLTDRGGFGSQ